MEYVYYNEKTDKLVVVSRQVHNSFGLWFFPAHGIIYIGDL